MGQLDRIVEPAQTVDQPQLLGLLARPDAALGRPGDRPGGNLAAVGDDADEAVIDRVDAGIDLLVLLRKICCVGGCVFPPKLDHTVNVYMI